MKGYLLSILLSTEFLGRPKVYLDERLTFTFDPLFHAGCFYGSAKTLLP